MARCVTCDGEVEQEDSGWCDRCSRFGPLLVGSGFSARPSREIRDEINAVLKADRGRTRNPRWRSLLNHYSEGETEWAFTDEKPARLPPSPWCIDEDVWGKQIDELEEVLDVRGYPDGAEARRVLQRGITLPDGAHLSCVSQVWAINGEPVPGPIPYTHLLKALRPTPRAREMTEGCDLPKLLSSLMVVTTNLTREDAHGQRQHREIRRLNRMFMRRYHAPQNQMFDGADLFIRWHRIFHNIPRPNDEYGGQFFWERMGAAINEREAQFSDINWDELLESSGPWVTRWREIASRDEMIKMVRLWAGPILRVKRGRLQLRAIKSGKWTWFSLPPWPKLWALLVNWSLSPPSSIEHQRLRALQWTWFSPNEELIPPAPERRALGLLRQVCEVNERLTLPEEGECVIHIEGTSGLFYAVGPGPGAHGARFSVRGAHSLDELGKGGGERLCIHENGDFNRLPIGDVVVSVLLTLMDDLTSAERLEPLSIFIHRQRSGIRQAEREDGPEPPQWVMDQRRRFRHRGNRRRWLTLFPTMFRVLTNLPLGSRVLIPRNTPQIARVEQTDVRWHVQTQEERELSVGLARLAGFREVDDGVGEFQEFERREVPIEGVRRELVEMLGPYERRHGRAGEPPWWNLFPDPVPEGNLGDILPPDLNRVLDAHPF